MVLAALVRLVGLDMVVWMPRISCACGVLLLLWSYRVLRRRFSCGPEVAALAVGSLALFPPFAAWASSGLETMPFALAFFATLERLVLRRDGPDWRGGAVAGCALLLVRVEGFAWCAFLGLLAAFTAWRARTPWRRPLLRWALVLGVLFAAFLIHRRLYFERWVSNTTRAKVILDADPFVTFLSGWNYVLVFTLTFLAPLAALPAAAWMTLRHRRDPAALALVAASFAFPAFAVAVGGDFMCMGRMLVPGFAAQALLLGVALRDLLAGAAGAPWRRAACAAAGGGVIALGLLPIASLLPGGPRSDVQLVAPQWLAAFNFRLNTEVARTETQVWRMQKVHAENLAREGRALALVTKPGESLVQGAIGAIGYYSELFIYDRYGLVTRAVAEMPAQPGKKRSPGHDRAVGGEFFLEYRPTYWDHFLVPGTERRRIVSVVSEWKTRPGARAYAPFLVRLRAADGFPGEVLILQKRVPEGHSVESAWSIFEAQIPEFRQRNGER